TARATSSAAACTSSRAGSRSPGGSGGAAAELLLEVEDLPQPRRALIGARARQRREEVGGLRLPRSRAWIGRERRSGCRVVVGLVVADEQAVLPQEEGVVAAPGV